MTRRKYIVQGKVQGVWFRESTRRLAVELGLSGHAINLADGSVEVVAEGDAAALDKLAAWLLHGPPQARVENLVPGEVDGEVPPGFRTGRG